MSENHPQSLRLSVKTKKSLRDSESLAKNLHNEIPAQDLLDYSDETIAQCYRLALLLLGEKRYEEAIDAFLFLVVMNPHQYDFWIGLGMVQQLCHRYELAIDAYEVAAICDLLSPIPYFYLAKCLFAIHDRVSAMEALNLAIETSGDQEEFHELKLQAEKARATLEIM